MGRLLTTALLLVPFTVLLAQAPPRDEVTGEVVDRDGKPWPGASVTLLHAAHSSLVDPRYVDRVAATSDERGQIRGELLAGMPYVAWATEPLANGSFRCTTLATGVVAGAPLRLREGDVRWQRRVRPEIHASWGPGLRFVARGRIGPFLQQEPLTLTDGVLTLPAFPGPVLELHAFDGDFAVFATPLATSDSARAREPELRTTLAAVRNVSIGARSLHALRFLDARGRPVANAQLLDGSELDLVIARTDADGVAKVARAGDQYVPAMTLATGPAGEEAVVDFRTYVADGAGPPGEVRMGATTLAEGRVEMRAKVPADALPLVVDKVAWSESEAGWAMAPRRLWTDAAGAFRLAGRSAGQPFWIAAVLTPEQRMHWSRMPADAPISPLALLQTKTAATDLALRLDALVAVEVRVADPHGRPAAGVQLIVIPLPANDSPSHQAHTPLPLHTDRSGRARFLAPPTTEVAIWALASAGAASLRTTVDARRKELRLDQRLVLPVRITDDAGKPVRDVEIYLDAEDSPKMTKEARQLLPCFEMLRHERPFSPAVTDADGCADLLVPLLGCSVELQLNRGRKHDFIERGWHLGPPAERVTFVFGRSGR
jgi:hypothetical protein